MKEILTYIKKYFEVLAAVFILTSILVARVDFYQAIIIMLEFIVIMEVVRMVSDFIRKEKLRLRFVIDIFIIFLIRDVVILTTHKNRDHFDILFLLFVIFIFFIFRILAVKFSPGIIKVSEDTIIENKNEDLNNKEKEKN